MKRLLAPAFGLLLGSTAFAGDVALSKAWIPDAPPSAMTRAAYLTFENTGDSPVAIVSVSAEGFGMAHLHESKMKGDGVMTMSLVDQLDVAPGALLEMAPGGLHIMLMHAKAPLAVGDSVPLTLTLSDGQKLVVNAIVRDRNGSS